MSFAQCIVKLKKTHHTDQKCLFNTCSFNGLGFHLSLNLGRKASLLLLVKNNYSLHIILFLDLDITKDRFGFKVSYIVNTLHYTQLISTQLPTKPQHSGADRIRCMCASVLRWLALLINLTAKPNLHLSLVMLAIVY